MNLRYRRLTDPNLNFAKFKVGDLVKHVANPITYDYFGHLVKIDEGLGVVTEVYYYETSHIFPPHKIVKKCEYHVYWFLSKKTHLVTEDALSEVKASI